MVGSGGPAASTFCESLADADAAALMRLVMCTGVILPDRRARYDALESCVGYVDVHRSETF